MSTKAKRNKDTQATEVRNRKGTKTCENWRGDDQTKPCNEASGSFSLPCGVKATFGRCSPMATSTGRGFDLPVQVGRGEEEETLCTGPRTLRSFLASQLVPFYTNGVQRLTFSSYAQLIISGVVGPSKVRVSLDPRRARTNNRQHHFLRILAKGQLSDLKLRVKPCRNSFQRWPSSRTNCENKHLECILIHTSMCWCDESSATRCTTLQLMHGKLPTQVQTVFTFQWTNQ